MSAKTKSISSSCSEDESELRRGPWTVDEDSLLIQYIASHGEGRWNLLAKLSGLRRTGKSCRLRWLNYLKPDVKRGNLSPEEQLLILDLHSKWGNRWSKIAQFLPGRTDNEIKNYWRTRVQKQARHLNIDTSSIEFQNMIRCFWMPRLLQKIEGEASFSSSKLIQNPTISQPPPQHFTSAPQIHAQGAQNMSGTGYFGVQKQNIEPEYYTSSSIMPSQTVEISKMSQFPECHTSTFHANNVSDMEAFNLQGTIPAPAPFFPGNFSQDCYVAENNWIESDLSCSMWNMDELLAI